MTPETHPVIGVFASDHGPGDAERATLMSQVGSFLARKGAKLVCLGDGGVPIPLVTSARTAGGEVTLLAGDDYTEPSAFDGVRVEHLPDREARLARLAALSHIYLALPGSLASASSLFLTWARGGGGAGRRPVVFYDHRDAFKVVRGYAADVIATSIKNHDRYVQFAVNPDDMWNKIAWLVDQGATVL
jgi:predicted Rossmann-fold nucleotide-binding protein